MLASWQSRNIQMNEKGERSMMKSIVACLGLMMLSGCITANYLVSPRAEPQVGERYRVCLRTLKVVQVCNDSVYAMHESYEGLRIRVVPLVNDYVTDSYLRSGLYEYVGPYTYEKIKDSAGNSNTHTVRLFKEVNEEK